MFSHLILWVTPGNSEKVLEKWRVGILSRIIWLNLGKNQGNSLIFTKIAISQIDIFWTSRVPRMPKFGICNVPSRCSKRYLGFFLFLIFLWKMPHFVPKNRSNWQKTAKKLHFDPKNRPKNQNLEKSKITFGTTTRYITYTKFGYSRHYRSPENVILRYRDFVKIREFPWFWPKFSNIPRDKTPTRHFPGFFHCYLV